jgi:site-specific recombinase XerD
MSQLTELSIKALRPSDKYVTVWDAIPGFGVRVGLRSKTYVVVRGKNRERITIGKFPDMKLADARAEAKRLLAAEKEPRTVRVSFKAARELFLEENYRDRSPRTRYQIKRLLERHFKSMEGEQLVDITDSQVERSLKRLAGTPSEQLHAYRALRTFFKWCTRSPRKYIKRSPMDEYEAPSKDKKGTRTLTDNELTAIWKASDTPPRVLFRLMLLWGTRNTETTLIEPQWVKGGVLTIPGAHTKNGRDHAIPILTMAQTILDHCKTNHSHFFPGRWGDGHISYGALGKLKREVMDASGTKDWQLRDIRRTFRSNMARLGVAREVCEVLINHAPPVLDEIYDRYDRITEKHDALKKYEAFIQALITQG